MSPNDSKGCFEKTMLEAAWGPKVEFRDDCMVSTMTCKSSTWSKLAKRKTSLVLLDSKSDGLCQDVRGGT